MMTKTITVTHSPCADDETPFSYEENGFIRWVDEVFQENYKKSPDTPFPTLEQAFILLEKLGYKWEVSVPARKCYLCESEDKLVSWGSFCLLVLPFTLPRKKAPIRFCPWCKTTLYVKDKVRYCISCRNEQNHTWNAIQKELECSNCGLLALDEPIEGDDNE